MIYEKVRIERARRITISSNLAISCSGACEAPFEMRWQHRGWRKVNFAIGRCGTAGGVASTCCTKHVEAQGTQGRVDYSYSIDLGLPISRTALAVVDVLCRTRRNRIIGSGHLARVRLVDLAVGCEQDIGDDVELNGEDVLHSLEVGCQRQSEGEVMRNKSRQVCFGSP